MPFIHFLNFKSMKKVMLMAVAVLFSAATVFAVNPYKSTSNPIQTKKVKPAKVQYTCPMHPEVLSSKPGKCPKCGMTLVKKEAAKKPAKTKM
jgi:hypothetical protein